MFSLNCWRANRAYVYSPKIINFLKYFLLKRDFLIRYKIKLSVKNVEGIAHLIDEIMEISDAIKMSKF